VVVVGDVDERERERGVVVVFVNGVHAQFLIEDLATQPHTGTDTSKSFWRWKL
jgi:hypothetical protein